MNGYTDFIKSVADSRGGNYSKASLVDLSMAIYNEKPSFPIYTKRGETYTVTEVCPGDAIRQQLIAPILKQFGVDKAELDKLNDMPTNRAGAEALADYSLLLIKEYISQNGMGRRLTLPSTAPDETIQSIGTVKVEETTRATNMIVKDGDSDNYVTKATGKNVTTQDHYKLVGRNRVPAWLKKTTDATAALPMAA